MKKPDINVAEILKKLSFLKNNLGLLVPIIIAVVAVLLFIPARLLSSNLRQTVEQTSLKTAQQITSLTKQLRDANPPEAMEKYIAAYAEDVNEIDAMVAHTVYRELLAYDLFQDTNQTSVALFDDFGQRYRTGIETQVAGLQAGECPSDAEIVAALQSAPQLEVDGRSRLGRTGTRSYAAGRGSTQWSAQTMSEVERGIFEEICTSKARAAKVYASAANVAGYTAWTQWKFEDRDQAYKDCWAWQMGYWIVEDVLTTIRTMNEDYPNVLAAPVKRLMNVSFKLEQTGMVSSGSRRGYSRKQEERPTYIKDMKGVLTTPCTGRFTSAEEGIDIIHFEVRVVVDESQVLPFIRQLCSAKPHKFYGFDGRQSEQTYEHNQITVLETTVMPIDPIHIAHQSYRYGPNPAAELHLICEYALSRAPAFEEIKPQQVKDELAGAEDEQ
jgi:hypothetical protein